MIELHSDEGGAHSAAMFENAEWLLSSEGLEHRATGYFIAREMIAMRRGDLWEWPLHLSEKAWCRALPLREAFLAALTAFAIPRDADLSRSFAIGFGLKAGSGASKATGDFVVLGDVLRPKAPASGSARKRSLAHEGRGGNRRNAMPVTQRVVETGSQRAAL